MWVTYSQEFKETSVNQDPLWSQFHFRRLRRNKHSPKIIAGFFPYKTAMLLGFHLLHSWIYNFHLTREACWLFSVCWVWIEPPQNENTKWKVISLWFRYLVTITALVTNQQLLYKRSAPGHHIRGDTNAKLKRDTVVWRPLFIVRDSSAKILNTGNSNGILRLCDSRY